MKSQAAIAIATTAILGSVAVVGGQRLSALDSLVRQGSLDASDREAGAAQMARDLERQKQERSLLLGEIHRLEGLLEQFDQERASAIGQLRSEFQTSQVQLENLLSRSTGQLTDLESSISKLEGAEYAALIHDLSNNVSQRWSVLEARLDLTDGRVESASNALASIDEKIDEDTDLTAMWDGLMGPVVKLTGTESVGSGVRLESIQVDDGYRTLVLTAWHVVRDIIDDEGSEGAVPITIYNRFGIDTIERGTLVDFDASLDIALLELDDHEFHPKGAKLASAQAMANMRVFQPIIAVGCPLGNDPVPSRGELSDTSHFVDGQRYWMINAPTFIGNSGGGIFDARTFELVGIFSKIYNYGSDQQTIIPHMGLMTPLDRIYDWINTAAPGALDTD